MTLFRAPVLSEFQKTKVTSVQRRWKVFTLVTWVVTAGAGFTYASRTEFKGDSRGDHSLRPFQHGLRTIQEAFVTGDLSRISFTPPPLPPRAAEKESDEQRLR